MNVMYFIIFGIVIFILIFIIIEVVFYNKFQMARIRISEAENNIDILLQKKFQLLERAIKIIEEKSWENGEILHIKRKNTGNQRLCVVH